MSWPNHRAHLLRSHSSVTSHAAVMPAITRRVLIIASLPGLSRLLWVEDPKALPVYVDDLARTYLAILIQDLGVLPVVRLGLDLISEGGDKISSTSCRQDRTNPNSGDEATDDYTGGASGRCSHFCRG